MRSMLTLTIRSPARTERKIEGHGHLTENSIASIEVGLRRKCHKPLASTGVWPRQGHSHGAFGVRYLVYLIGNGVVRAAQTIASQVSPWTTKSGMTRWKVKRS